KFVSGLLLAGSWMPVAVVVNDYVGSVMAIEGRSMRPAFNETDGARSWVLVRKLWVLDSLRNRDVVVLRSPQNPEAVVVKRIVATEGEEVRTRGTYPKPLTVVPKGHVWVEGDNIHSVDSNTYGPVPTGLILGKVSYVLHP
ncbi:hypothetical protein CANCADRAFT_12307, partial [Tortispora caseinolytica NRRL Y-17796]